MDIYPQDLGPDYCPQLLQWRGLLKGGKTNEAARLQRTMGSFMGTMVGAPAGGWLGLICLHAEPAFAGSTWDFVLLGMGVGAGVGYGCGVLADRWNADKCRIESVTEQGLTHFNEREKDDLKRDYLNAVSAVVALPTPHEESARHNIRQAVRSLGQAAAQLPPPRAAADVGALRAEAGRLAAQARDEPDPVIAASLTRQAEAFGRRADTAARVAVLVRRGQTLRAEVAAQVQAFQAALTAGQINGGHGGDFAALAEGVAQVMQEADALADARAELEAVLAPMPQGPEATPLRAGQPG